MKRITGVYWQPTPDTLNDHLAQLAALRANAAYVPHTALDDLPLADLHAQGLEIYADIAVFAGEDLRRDEPDSAPVDATGARFERDDWYVPACPNHPGLRRRQLTRIEAILDKHGANIDALWLDFIRFPVRWEGPQPNLTPRCFCRHCLNGFLQQDQLVYSPAETRRLAQQILNEQVEAWVRWKCASITDFVANVREAIEARDLSLQLGMFSLPWRRSDFDGAIRTVAGQDLGQLAHYVDTFSPMVYHKLCAQPVDWIGHVVRDVQAWTQRPVLPIIQAVDSPDPMPATELDAALQTAINATPTGVMIFTFAPLLENADKSSVTRKRFSAYSLPTSET